MSNTNRCGRAHARDITVGPRGGFQYTTAGGNVRYTTCPDLPNPGKLLERLLALRAERKRPRASVRARARQRVIRERVIRERVRREEKKAEAEERKRQAREQTERKRQQERERKAAEEEKKQEKKARAAAEKKAKAAQEEKKRQEEEEKNRHKRLAAERKVEEEKKARALEAIRKAEKERKEQEHKGEGKEEKKPVEEALVRPLDFLREVKLLEPTPKGWPCKGCYVRMLLVEEFLEHWCEVCRRKRSEKVKIVHVMVSARLDEKTTRWGDEKGASGGEASLRKALQAQSKEESNSVLIARLEYKSIARWLGHVTLLFFSINPPKKEISIRVWDPVAEQLTIKSLATLEATALMRPFLREELQKWLPGWNVAFGIVVCPYGLQTREKKLGPTEVGKEPKGYCGLYSALLALLSVSFPDREPEQLTSQLYEDVEREGMQLRTLVQRVSVNLSVLHLRLLESRGKPLPDLALCCDRTRGTGL